MSERLTVRDVAQVMKCSEDKVIRVFARMEGVIDLGQPENLSRRRYRVLRIPKQVVERYLTTKAGRSIRIEVPERAVGGPHSGRRVQFSISPRLDYRTGFDQTIRLIVIARGQRRRHAACAIVKSTQSGSPHLLRGSVSRGTLMLRVPG
ncbi:MAG TPA: hypothetical protein VMP68_14285 [Candidatus Eisenbacteria bacterium]|nr:hypothetical protein [Candidatus Eisenbacteria bacterium]